MNECVVRMEMPESCDRCPCLDDYGDYPRCRISGEQRGYNFPIHEKRMPNCPIICQLPKGHGRLVDKDELFYDMFVMADGRVLPNYDCDNFHIDMHVKDIKQHIFETPTIVPAEAERSE